MEPLMEMLSGFGEARTVNMVRQTRTTSGKDRYFISLNRICLKWHSATMSFILRFDRSKTQLNKSSIYEINTTTLHPSAHSNLVG